METNIFGLIFESLSKQLCLDNGQKLPKSYPANVFDFLFQFQGTGIHLFLSFYHAEIGNDHRELPIKFKCCFG